MRRRIILLAAACLGAHAALAADPQPYSVKFDSTGNKSLDSAIKGSSQLDSLRTSAPAGPFALIGRAQADIERMQTALESYGFYQHKVTITVAGLALDDAKLAPLLVAAPSSPAIAVQVHIETGPLFHLRHVTLEGDVSDQAREAFGLKEGATAAAADVLAAGSRLQDAMQNEGHAYAKVDEPIAYQDAHDPVLDVIYKATPGPIYHLGPIRIRGLKRMHETFVQRLLTIHSGDLYVARKVERARADLLSLGVFAGVTVNLPKQEQVQGDELPITFRVSERKRHAVSLQAAYSTDLGASGGVTWTDRNVFGNAETLAVTGSIINAGGNATTSVGYQAGVALTQPDFLRTDQSLQYNVGILKQDLEAYDQDALTAGVAITRTLSTRWKASIGLSAQQEQIDQEDVTNHYTLLALPITLKFDSTGLTNPLDDPLHGMRASMAVTPTKSFSPTFTDVETGKPNTGSATFVILQGTVSGYLDFNRFGWSPAGRNVLAARALAARAYGATQFSLPPDQRFYGGGSATVRGYQYQSIGPQFLPPPAGAPPTATAFPNPYQPEGGVELAALSVEYRRRFTQNIGGALFVDAGAVTAKSGLFEGQFHEDRNEAQYETGIGAGTGVRYYTPIGPVRIDVAVPLKHTNVSGSVQLYIGLGQAF
jgi:translocation and assembly module TamA